MKKYSIWGIDECDTAYKIKDTSSSAEARDAHKNGLLVSYFIKPDEVPAKYIQPVWS